MRGAQSSSATPQTRLSRFASLPPELIVQVVNKDLLYPRLGEVVLAIQRDELTTDTLELRERHGVGW